MFSLFSQKDVSGSEITGELADTIELWPGPRFVFPLLSWLHEEGSIERVQFEEGYLKRFSLTQPGNVLLTEYELRRDVFRKRFFSTRFFNLNLIQGIIKISKASERLLLTVGGMPPYIEKHEPRGLS